MSDGGDDPGADAAPRAPTLPSLTGLRAVAALVVFGSHVRWLLPTTTLFSVAGHDVNIRAVLQQGDVGVSLFFVLSGMVLHWNARPGELVSAFLRRRAARIYPASSAVWGAWMIGVALGVLPVTGALAAIAALALVQAWVPTASVYWGVNPPTWSLSCEVFFYACFPALSRRVASVSPRGLPRLVAVLVATAIGIGVALQVAAGRLVDADSAFWAGYIFPPTRLVEFVIGIALAEQLRRGRWRSVPLGWTAVLAAASYLVAGRAPRVLSGVAVTLVPIVLLLLASAGADLAGRRSVVGTRVVQHLGVVSYAFFLVQYGCIWPFREQLPDAAPTFAGGLALVALCAVVSYVLAEALHHLVERPAWRALTRGAPPPLTASTASSSRSQAH